MKKQTLAALLLVLMLAAADGRTVYAETTPSPFNVLIIMPGMTRSVDIRQSDLFPLGCPMFFVAVAGQGTLGISVRKDDVAGDTIFMLGAAVSAAGTTPVYRIGLSQGMIDQILEIEQYGFVWLWCGVAFSQSTPRYNSQLRLSLAP